MCVATYSIPFFVQIGLKNVLDLGLVTIFFFSYKEGLVQELSACTATLFSTNPIPT